MRASKTKDVFHPYLRSKIKHCILIFVIINHRTSPQWTQISRDSRVPRLEWLRCVGIFVCNNIRQEMRQKQQKTYQITEWNVYVLCCFDVLWHFCVDDDTLRFEGESFPNSPLKWLPCILIEFFSRLALPSHHIFKNFFKIFKYFWKNKKRWKGCVLLFVTNFFYRKSSINLCFISHIFILHVYGVVS